MLSDSGLYCSWWVGDATGGFVDIAGFVVCLGYWFVWFVRCVLVFGAWGGCICSFGFGFVDLLRCIC